LGGAWKCHWWGAEYGGTVRIEWGLAVLNQIVRQICTSALYLLLFLTSASSTKGEGNMHPGKNLLGLEKSPYLRQHEDNPIWWQPWSEQSLALAKALDRPVFLSIGYSTCHWCHVMEGESFVDEKVAALLNKDFVSIKVDREERPDVDSVYMTAVQLMSGRGRPFWAGTFLTKEQLIELLEKTAAMWQSPRDRKRIETSGEEVIASIRQVATPSASFRGEIHPKILRDFYNEMLISFDQTNGGFSDEPKFPPSMSLTMLLRIHKRTQNPTALHMVEKTLDAMAAGGIHDHLAGGFHRYTTDAAWITPHFEKMLYDNALLTAAYTEAYLVTKNPMYEAVAKRTADYVLESMQSEEGGFYSAEDADSEKAEGKFYLWQYDELQRLLSKEEFSALENTFELSAEGNFSLDPRVAEIEHAAGLSEVKNGNILVLKEGLTPLTYLQDPLLQAAMAKMKASRETRQRPGRDEKVLTGWNGLMIAALAQLAQASADHTPYLAAAEAAAEFIGARLEKDGALLRRYHAGEAKIGGFLEDYAYLIYGLTDLYEASFDLKWLRWAMRLQEKQDELFWDEELGGYFDSDGKDETVLVRTKDYLDNAQPSANSVAALNLLRLSALTAKPKWRAQAENLLKAGAERINRHPHLYPFLLRSVDFIFDRAKEIVVVGPADAALTRDLLAAFTKEHFIPNKVLAYVPETIGLQEGKNHPVPMMVNKTLHNGKPTAYICEHGVCQFPLNSVEKASQTALASESYKVGR